MAYLQNWIDGKLVWNASLYGGQSKIQFKNVAPYTGIWTPQIRLLKYIVTGMLKLVFFAIILFFFFSQKIFSGKDDHFLYLNLIYAVTVFSNGSVWAESTICTFSAWCLNANRNWPHEKVNCEIHIQLDQFTSSVLMPLNKNFPMTRPVRFEICFIELEIEKENLYFSIKDLHRYDVDDGEWHITETNAVAKVQSTLDTPYVPAHESLSNTAYILSIDVTLERNSLFYNQLISVPLIGMDKISRCVCVCVCVQCAFFVSLQNSLKFHGFIIQVHFC